jgi:hypothetical protein
MLESRSIRSTLSGETLGAAAARRCPQGGVLSPLLWSLVVDNLIWVFYSNGHFTVGYVDDIAILINGKFLRRVSEVLQTILCTVQGSCERPKLSINPNKTLIINFTRKRNIKGLKKPILFSKTIQISGEVKYLGITLDEGLTWEEQLNKVISKAYKAFWTCRGTFGRTRGLKPKVIYSLYTAVVRTIVTYAATIWWPRVNSKQVRHNLANCKGWPAWNLQGQ